MLLLLSPALPLLLRGGEESHPLILQKTAQLSSVCSFGIQIAHPSFHAQRVVSKHCNAVLCPLIFLFRPSVALPAQTCSTKEYPQPPLQLCP